MNDSSDDIVSRPAARTAVEHVDISVGDKIARRVNERRYRNATPTTVDNVQSYPDGEDWTLKADAEYRVIGIYDHGDVDPDKIFCGGLAGRHVYLVDEETGETTRFRYGQLAADLLADGPWVSRDDLYETKIETRFVEQER
jgi:hypothetical protein